LDGVRYLIVVDYFSRWFVTIKLNRIDSTSVINALKNIFVNFGIPEIIKSDGGLQFNSLMFKNFSIDYDFVHIISDPYYPQGNACAERAVQTAKRLLKQADPLLALMAYRTTPLDSTGYSPSQLLIGRNMRTKLPTLPVNLTPCWPDFVEVRENDNEAKNKSAANFNRRKGARKLPEIPIGQQVRVRLPLDKAWSAPERILSRQGDTSYAIRNRRYLQVMPENPVTNDKEQCDSKTEQVGGEISASSGGDGSGEASIQVNPSPTVPSTPLPESGTCTDKPNDIVKPVYQSRFGRPIKPVIKYQA
jgi:hypothetical protein